MTTRVLALWLMHLGGGFFAGHALAAEAAVPVGPIPAEEPLSTRFAVRAGPVNVPVYLARVGALSPEERRHEGLPVESSTDLTSFASLDVAGPTEITVTCPDNVSSVKLLPSSSGITPQISGNKVTLTVSTPGQLTLEVNGNWISSLHLFANPPEANIPRPDDPNVLYYGPGVHVVEGIKVTSGQTVYLAPGAVVYGQPSVDNPHRAIFSLEGTNIALRGRGIIDASRCPRGTRSNIWITGTNVQVEGVILRDAGGFNIPVRRSAQVKISNVKIFGWRGNSDGIDICNSHHVEVSDSFLRTYDDLIVLKTDKNQGDEADIDVHHCVLWNEFAHALSLGAELREPVARVRFSDCDIIHDKGREWLLRVYNCDSAWVKEVTFDDIRIEEARRLMSVWIGRAVWSKEEERGHDENVSFRTITSVTPELPGPWADLVGFDATHLVDQVQFQHVRVGHQPLTGSDVRENGFVRNVQVLP